MPQSVRRLGAPLVLLAVSLLFFSPALFFDRIFLFRDLLFFHYPLKRYWISALQSGQLPFLNSALNGGQPILANPNYAVFYPGNLLYFVLPFDIAWNLTLVGHVFWAGLGVYWLARVLKCPRFAALSGAFVFSFCGPLLSCLNQYNLLTAISWLPWICGLSIVAIAKGGFWVILAAACLGMQLLCGEPTIQAFTALLLITGWCVALIRSDSKSALVQKGIFIAVIGCLLACVQLIPALEWLPYTQRGLGLPFRQSAAYWSLHPIRLIEFLVPHFFGNPLGISVEDFWGGMYSDANYPYILKLYAGWLPLLMIPAALKDKWGRAGILLFLIAMILSFGHRLPGYYFLYEYFPVFKIIRYPEKFSVLALFGLSVAFAIAVSQIVDKASLRLGFLLGALFLTLIFLLPWLSRDFSLSVVQLQTRRWAVLQSILCGVVSLVVLYLMKRSDWKRSIIVLVPIVAFVDLSSITWDIPETYPSEIITRKPVLLEKIPEMQGASILHLGEVQSDLYFSSDRDPTPLMKDSIYPLVGLSWDFSYGATNDVDRMGWQRSTRREASIINGFPDSISFDLIRRSGIDWVISLEPVVRPQLSLVRALSASKQFTVYVYRLMPPSDTLVHWDQGTGEILHVKANGNHIHVRCKSTTGGTLTILRNCLEGWSADVDGKKVLLQQTSEGWLSIRISPGMNLITLKYFPPGLTTGIFLSTLGLIALGLAIALRKKCSLLAT
jgi:Bacterial membrane protein YfhO